MPIVRRSTAIKSPASDERRETLTDSSTTWVSSGHQPMGFAEFVVVIASIMALNPLAMDMMLPALPDIATAFHITEANRPQEVLSTFLIGFGIGQFVMGPLSDRFGRRAVLIDGMALYCIASIIAVTAQSFETLAAGARAARSRHLGDAGDRDLDRARLLCRPPHGERDVARDDGVHRRARDRAVAGTGGAAVRTMARHLPRAVAVRIRRAGLERDTDAGNAAGVRAQVARACATCSTPSARP